MIGRQVIETDKAFTKEELYEFMRENWDVNEYNDFFFGRPTPGSIAEYICLPATQKFMVIVYPKPAKKAGKKSKVVLSVCDTPIGLREKVYTSFPTHNAFYGAYKITENMKIEKERKGPAEDALQRYAEYMRTLLNK